MTNTRSATDKDTGPSLSSMTKAILLATAAFGAPTLTAGPARAQVLLSPEPTRPVAATSDYALAAAINEWNALRQTDSLPFASYARFLLAHPGWPGEDAMRKTAERALRADTEDANLVASYFTRFAPTTATGALRFAEALDGTGRRDAARTAARTAWTIGALGLDDEQRLLARFPGLLTSADHDLRTDRLLWARNTAAAARQIAYASPARQPLFATRLALQQQRPDAAASLGYAGAATRADAGLIADRAAWLRATRQEPAARAALAQPRVLSAPPLDAAQWFEMLLSFARAASADRQDQLAYDIARQVDDAYAPGTDVSKRPLGERDDYTSLTWLAGSTALNRLGRAADAIGLFDRYARAARSPQTRSKGLYWAGRAALAAGRSAEATTYFTSAAAYFDQFYGQLATERLARPLALPLVTTRLEASRNQRDAYFQQETVRAAQLTGARGDRVAQTLFLRQIAQAAASDTDHLFGAELSQSLRRPDLGVMVGRSAGINGLRDYVRAGFPVVAVPSEAYSNWTMVHAIARQESQFDTGATSRVGARGLMQLMPGTARDTAGKMGSYYDQTALTSDGQYNIRLGAYYFRGLMDYYGGSYPLAVAAYNAGAGNVNKWLRLNGDPRAGADVLAWIEAIPFSETRGYVQRVLENAVVYDLIEPSRARVRTATPLTTYLGKRYPG